MRTYAKNVLVTGGAGFIGSHACKALHRAGYQPIVYDNLSKGHPWAVRWGPLEVGDIHDRQALVAVLHKYKPNKVIHFAAAIEAGESLMQPGWFYYNNTCGALSLLNTAVEHGVQHIIFSSTAAVYGEPVHLPITEDHPQNPINPYGATKMMVERMIQDICQARGLRAICLRYFNAAGADPDGELGEEHQPESHLIPLLLQAAMGKMGHFTLYGNDYPTLDGTCIRDYIHVNDLVDAHLLALHALENGHVGGVYNVGNGVGFSVGELLTAARQITTKNIPVHLGARRAGDCVQLVADASKIKQELGWTPRYPHIEEMIATAWRWYSHYSCCR